METFSALLVLCEGNSPVIGEFPWQRSVMRCFDIFFKQSRRMWLETPSHSLWLHCNGTSGNPRKPRIFRLNILWNRHTNCLYMGYEFCTLFGEMRVQLMFTILAATSSSINTLCLSACPPVRHNSWANISESFYSHVIKFTESIYSAGCKILLFSKLSVRFQGHAGQKT